MLKIDLKPRPKNSFAVTKDQIITTLLIFIGLFASYKTYTYSSVANELFYLQTTNAVTAIKDLSDKTVLDERFLKGDYCGWEFTKGGEVTRSDNYQKSSRSAPVFTYADKENADNGKISICMKKIAVNDNSVNHNVVGIFLVLGIIYFLVRKEEKIRG